MKSSSMTPTKLVSFGTSSPSSDSESSGEDSDDDSDSEDFRITQQQILQAFIMMFERTIGKQLEASIKAQEVPLDGTTKLQQVS